MRYNEALAFAARDLVNKGVINMTARDILKKFSGGTPYTTDHVDIVRGKLPKVRTLLASQHGIHSTLVNAKFFDFYPDYKKNGAGPAGLNQAYQYLAGGGFRTRTEGIHIWQSNNDPLARAAIKRGLNKGAGMVRHKINEAVEGVSKQCIAQKSVESMFKQVRKDSVPSKLPVPYRPMLLGPTDKK